MSYSMYSTAGDHFDANISGMVFLLNVMERAGVDFEMGKGERLCEPYEDEGKTHQYKAQGSLITCFGTNDGWHVRTDECLHIAEKLEAIVETTEPVAAARVVNDYNQPVEMGPHRRTISIPFQDWERGYIREFIEFNRKSAVLGGYYVR